MKTDYAAVKMNDSMGNSAHPKAIITSPAGDVAIPRKTFTLDAAKIAKAHEDTQYTLNRLGQKYSL